MDMLKVVGLHELRSLNIWKGAAAESLGACFYVMLACGAGSEIVDGYSPSILQKALTTGFVVTIMVSAFWEVSGGHINPAVSLASTLCGKISVTRFFLYVIAQCAGSLTGAILIYAFTPPKFREALGVLSLHPDLTPEFGFVIEVLITFQLIWTATASKDPIRKFTGFQAPFAIGMSVTIGLMTGIPYTGGSMNPIRALGPAVVSGKTDRIWIYWAGPLTGSAVAVLTYRYVLKLSKVQEPEVKEVTSDDTSSSSLIKNSTQKDDFENIAYTYEKSYQRKYYQSL